LIGTSSGITWASTSTAGKILPMVQLLNPNSLWANPVSVDFKRFNILNNGVIELFVLDPKKIVECVHHALIDFDSAYLIYNNPYPVNFNTSRKIVYNLLCYLEFKYVLRHIKVNLEVYGMNIFFIKDVLLSVLLFPFTLLKNIFTKHLLRL
jgi:hypothetical protein